MIDKDRLPLDKPRRTPDHPTKSHVVKTRVDGKEKIIRFGEQGASTAGKPKAGESERMKAKRASFKARHAKNIAKGKSSPAYWADKVKWAEGGAVSMKPASPSDIIAGLMSKIRRGQQDSGASEFDAVAAALREARARPTRKSTLSVVREQAAQTPPPAESAAPVQPVASVALNAPAADNPYYAEAVRLAEKYDLPTNVFVSLVNQESRFNPQARSRKGAYGLAQLMPGTAKELGVDPTDPLQNLEGGARYLKQQLERFGTLPLALAAYNAGPGNVRKHGGIPPFKETQNYVASVMRQAGIEGYAEGGAVQPGASTVREAMVELYNNAEKYERLSGMMLKRRASDLLKDLSPTERNALGLFQASRARADRVQPEEFLSRLGPYLDLKINMNDPTQQAKLAEYALGPNTLGYVDWANAPDTAVVLPSGPVPLLPESDILTHELEHVLQAKDAGQRSVIRRKKLGNRFLSAADREMLERAQQLRAASAPDSPMQRDVLVASNVFENPLEVKANLASAAHRLSTQGVDFLKTPEGEALFPTPESRAHYYGAVLPGVPSAYPSQGTFVPADTTPASRKSYAQRAWEALTSKYAEGGEVEGYAGGGLVSKLARRAGKAAEDVAEQKMLQGFYRGYTDDYDALKAGEDTGKVFVSPQKPVGEYYGRKRAAQTGGEPHLEMILADPFGGKQYGHAVPMGPLNRSGVGQTMAREFKPEEIEEIIKLFNEGGYVSKFAEGGEVKAPPEMRATPQNPFFGSLARGVRSLQELGAEYQIPEAVPLLGGMTVDELFGLPGAARETERWSYGNYPLRVNPYAGRTASFVPEMKPGRQADVADTLLLGADVTGLGSLAGKYALKGAKAGVRAAGEELNRAVMEGEGLLAPLVSQAAQPAYVIKPKGGNWLSGSVDEAIEPLKSTRIVGRSPAERIPQHEALLNDPSLNADQLDRVRYQLDLTKSEAAADKWLDTKLKKYIQNEMGTPEDPIRRLADEGKLHFEPEPRTRNDLEFLYDVREQAGAPTDSQALTDLGAGWEERADFAINAMPAGRRLSEDKLRNYKYDASVEDKYPWLAKVPPETPTYSMIERLDTLGFDHLVDEMKNAMRPDSDLPARLRIDPAKLEKMTVPQVVEKVSQINAWRGEQMAAANAAKAMNPATQLVKEYPEQGYKWVELKQPELPSDALPEGWQMIEEKGGVMRAVSPNGERVLGKDLPDLIKNIYKRHPDTPGNPTKALEDALKYEGDTMGHCVGGYCPDVAEGLSRIYSLRDSKGEPHVTIEVSPTQRTGERAVDYRQLTPENYAKKYGDDSDLGSRIVQIKGKQNRAPKEEYLPFVQDFVKSGQWSEVGDIANAGLVKYKGEYRSPAEFEYRVEDGGWQNLLDFARERFPDQPSRQNNFITGIMQNPKDAYIRPAQPQQGFAAGGLVSAYNPADISALVNQVLEGEYV